MIESLYWKEELERIAKTLREVPKPRRWTERHLCETERDIMIGFFIVRMLELYKTTESVRKIKVSVFSNRAARSDINERNQYDIMESYDLGNESAEQKSAFYVSNQFIHASISYLFRDDTRNWSDVYIVSDYDKRNCIWRVPISEIRDLFFTVASNYPTSFRITWNEDNQDYDLATD